MPPWLGESSTVETILDDGHPRTALHVEALPASYRDDNPAMAAAPRGRTLPSMQAKHRQQCGGCNGDRDIEQMSTKTATIDPERQMLGEVEV